MFVYLWKVPWATQVIGTYNLVSYIIENSTYIKFQIFVVDTGWIFTDNTQELIIIFCLRLKDFIRKIPRLHRSLKFSVSQYVYSQSQSWKVGIVKTM